MMPLRILLRRLTLAEGRSIRDASGASKGARSQYLLRQQASENAASCIFIEPQYADKDAKVLARELQLPPEDSRSTGI